MNQHPYLRAYMAGIVVPTIFLLVAMTAFTIARYMYNVPFAIERVIVFPMAVVPNVWGVWNIVHLALHRRVPIGIFGTILPFILAPAGYLVARLTGFGIPHFVHAAFPFFFPVGLAIYYLAWKFLVAPLNEIVGVG